ncbi:MAG: monovalent cation/H(+) antiporter subunit G [Oscillospiraceae bacterium]|nr:monovalent cation/H(+) antiporter subunit G [Oscillospiraceae bacterium]
MIRLIIAVPFILAGIAVIISALIGNFKFGYVLNRMQIGATADTLGTMLIIIGLIVIKGFEILTVKLVIMILFLWMANPVASHFLARTEIISNENIKEECEVCDTDGNI